MQEKFSRILIGNVLKSIRTEKKIPIKKSCTKYGCERSNNFTI